MLEKARAYKDKSYTQLARIGKAASSPKRLEILCLLSHGPKTVEAIARASGMGIANTSQHLQTLLDARLVESRKQGNYSIYSLADPSVAHFIDSMQELADSRIAEMHRLKADYLAGRTGMEPIKPDQLLAKMKEGGVTLIDLRPRDEYELLHIPGARSIPFDELGEHLASLPAGHEIVAYCRGRYCMLSAEAVEILREHGFRAMHMEESAPDWHFEVSD